MPGVVSGPPDPAPRDAVPGVARQEKLAQMAAEIAGFFRCYPEERAVRSIAEHINLFWNRRMRADFLAAFAADPSRLAPLVGKALPAIERPAGGDEPPRQAYIASITSA